MMQSRPFKMLKSMVVFIALANAVAGMHGLHAAGSAAGSIPPFENTGALGLNNDGKEHQGTMQALVEAEGYPLEEHFVTTEDGYILGVYRIPHGRKQGAAKDGLEPKALSNGAPASPRPPVLLQHGLLDCSASWVVNGASRSLGFLLADAGFDVWMGNARGNSFSRNHTSLETSSEEFWGFTWDDHAAHDVPDTVRYVLELSGVPSLGYIGHSQGTTMALAAFATQPLLSQMVSVAVLLAPVAFTAHVKSPLVREMANYKAEEIFEFLGTKEFLSSGSGRLCVWMPAACEDSLGYIAGYNPDNINTTRLPVYLSYTPAGASVKNMAHWSQGVRQKGHHPNMTKFDYGTACSNWYGARQPCNRLVYGEESPPSYNLTNVQVPVMLVTGSRDKLADPQDVELLKAALPEKTIVAELTEESYEHLDFTWAHNAHQLIYPEVLKTLESHAMRPSTRDYA